MRACWVLVGVGVWDWGVGAGVRDGMGWDGTGVGVGMEHRWEAWDGIAISVSWGLGFMGWESWAGGSAHPHTHTHQPVISHHLTLPVSPSLTTNGHHHHRRRRPPMAIYYHAHPQQNFALLDNVGLFKGQASLIPSPFCLLMPLPPSPPWPGRGLRRGLDGVRRGGHRRVGGLPGAGQGGGGADGQVSTFISPG